MKRLLLAAALLLVAIPATAEVHGAWTALDHGDGKLDLRVTIREWNMFGSTLKVGEIPGLPATSTTPVQFQLRREAGTISFEGTFKNGDGGGHFTFVPNPRYLSSVRATGIDMDMVSNGSEEEMLLSLAMSDLTADYIRSIQPLFPGLTLREARRARSSGVTPQYVKSLRDAGVNITTAREASRVASLNITPKYVAELAAAGYRNLSVRDLTRLAANGINAEFIARFRSHQ